MNKDFQKQLDDRLSGMNWTDREQNSILHRIRRDEEIAEKPVRRGVPRWAAAVAAALMLMAGGAILSRQTLLPPQDQHMAAQPEGTDPEFAVLTAATAAVALTPAPTLPPAQESAWLPVQLPAEVPTMKEALYAVAQQCTEAVLIDVISMELRCQRNMRGWQICAIVYDPSSLPLPRYERRTCIVQKNGAGQITITSTAVPQRLSHQTAATIVTSSAENDVHLRQWEEELGKWYFWSYEDKAKYCRQYGVCPEGEWDQTAVCWTLPTADDMPYETASAAARTAVEKQFGISLSSVPLREDARLLAMGNAASRWEFHYWLPVQDGAGYVWLHAACAVPTEDSRDFYVRYAGITPELLTEAAKGMAEK